MNFRNHTNAELRDTLCNDPVRQNGQSAACEIGQRFLEGRIIARPSAEEAENQTEKDELHGYYEGQREERELIIENIMEMLCFNYANKIEAVVIDDLNVKIRDRFPELEIKERE